MAQKNAPPNIPRTVIIVLSQPSYGFLALGVALVVLTLLIWLFDSAQLVYVFGLDQPMALKWQFFFSAYRNTFIYLDNPIVFTRLIFSLLAGITVALAMYTRHQTPKKQFRKGADGGVAALIGAGCVTCGTSLLAPFFAIFGVALTTTAAAWLGIAANSIGIVLLFYAIQYFGNIARKKTSPTPKNTIQS